MIEKQQVLVNGQKVSCLTKEAEDPIVTIVFIHGFPFSSAIWEPQLLALPGNVKGVAYDIRGFGDSPATHTYFSIDLFARDLSALLSALHIEKAVLCGVSMGGYIALRACEAFPEQVAGLVLCDTNAVADSNEAKLKRFASIDQIMADNVTAFADQFVGGLFSEKTKQEKSGIVNFIHGLILNTSPHTLCGTQLALASRTDSSSSLASIKVPVMLVRGADDRLSTQEQIDFMATHITGAESHSIPFCGHLPNLEDAPAFNALLSAFLAKHF